MGLSVEKPKATFYVWMEVPQGYGSADFSSRLLSEGGIVTTPGNGFGSAGEGYVRMALTVGKKRMEEVVERIRRISL
jgi:LL-diaminopimelate aminotransferase